MNVGMRAAALSVVVALLSVPLGFAADIYSTSFEEFANGELSGQNDFITDPAVGLFSVGNVAGIARTGSKYVLVNGTTLPDFGYAYRNAVDNLSDLDISPEPVVVAGLSVAILNPQTAPANRPLQAGLVLFDQAVNVIGGIFFGSGGEIVTIDESNTATTVGTLPAGAIFNTYYDLQVIVDYVAGEVDLYLGGVLYNSFSTSATDFGDADLYAERTTTTGTIGYTAVFDDLYVRTRPIPEPAALGFAVPAAMLLKRRRVASVH